MNIQEAKKNKKANNYLLNTSNILYQYYDKDTGYKSVKHTDSDNKTVLDFFKSKQIELVNNDTNNIYSKKQILNKYLSYVE